MGLDPRSMKIASIKALATASFFIVSAAQAAAGFVDLESLSERNYKMHQISQDLENQWTDENIGNGGAVALQVGRTQWRTHPEKRVQDKHLKNLAVEILSHQFHQLTSDEIDPSTLDIKTTQRAFKRNDVKQLARAVTRALSYSATDTDSLKIKTSDLKPVMDAIIGESEATLTEACVMFDSGDGIQQKIVEIIVRNNDSQEALALYSAEGSMDGSSSNETCH